MKKTRTKFATFCLTVVLALSTFGSSVFAASPLQETKSVKFYDISNPYENVDWSSFGQYKTALHTHSFNSDGRHTLPVMVEEHYKQGFDVLAMTDHNYLIKSWDMVDKDPMDTQRLEEIKAGAGRDGKGMLPLSYTNEQSKTRHILSYWADYNNDDYPAEMSVAARMAKTIQDVEKAGGVSFIAHPGFSNGAYNLTGNRAAEGIAISNSAYEIGLHVDLLMKYPSCLGIEMGSAVDSYSIWDRILWDNILMETMPQGRSVWGFSVDDAHDLILTGFGWNMMLMPELTEENVRTSMETGAFYAVARKAFVEGVNANVTSLLQLGQIDKVSPAPAITDIAVEGNTITIAGEYYDTIEWVADGVVIATGNTLDIADHQDKINSYVRAQLKSRVGIAFTQPFGVKEATVVDTESAASVKKLSGNQNDLTITVTEFYSNGMKNVVAKTIKINNNAAGTYEIGGYKVYVDTKGNDQIRECYIVK